MCSTSTVYARLFLLFFFFNDTATTEIYTLSLHDALPISSSGHLILVPWIADWHYLEARSEEHTSELQSPVHLVCRLLLEKKNKQPQRPLRRQERVHNHKQQNRTLVP